MRSTDERLARLQNDVSHPTHTHAASLGESQGGPSLAAADPRFAEGGKAASRWGRNKSRRSDTAEFMQRSCSEG